MITHVKQSKKTDVLVTCSPSVIGININNPEGTRQVSETLHFNSALMQLISKYFSAVYKDVRF
jgi:hypothetical protein